MKKIVSILTALCCIATLSAATVHASIIEPWQFTCAEGENGAAIVTTYSSDYGFLVVTDGTELEPFHYQGNLNQPLRTVEELVRRPQTWDWEASSKSLIAQYDHTNKYYHVDLNCTAGWDNLSAIARNFMLEHDGVVDVILLEHAYSGTPTWYGDFEIYYQDDATDEEIAAFWENADKSALLDVQEEYDAEDNIPDYEILSRGFAACETFLCQNAELASCVNFVQPSVLIAENGRTTYAGVSAWDGIGDTDGNAEIDASDASMILELSSAAGADIETAPNKSADVNADGYVDAVDASIVLVYATKVGSGEDITIFQAMN